MCVCKGADDSAWYKLVEILKMATSSAGELFEVSGSNRDPHLLGKSGMANEGTCADLLLVEGLSAIIDTDNLKITTTGGVIYKSTLDWTR
jgi:hypothetical protein